MAGGFLCTALSSIAGIVSEANPPSAATIVYVCCGVGVFVGILSLIGGVYLECKQTKKLS